MHGTIPLSFQPPSPSGYPGGDSDWTKPSLEGFASFVAFKLLHNPDERYDYMFLETCPVGEYLHAIGAYTQDHPHRFRELDELACGGGDNRHWRDARGRFTSDKNKVGKQWTYRELWNRIRGQLGSSRLQFSVRCEIADNNSYQIEPEVLYKTEHLQLTSSDASAP